MSRKGENITKRKDGRWEARVIYSYGEDNRAKYRYLYGKTYAEARAKKEYALSQIISCNSFKARALITLNELFDMFLTYKEPNVKPSTLAHYRNIYLSYIKNPLGARRLTELSAIHMESYTLSILYNGGSRKKGLSPKTVRDILGLLCSALKYAVSHNYISNDILSFKMPRYYPRQISVFDKAEQAKLEQFLLGNNTDSYKMGVYLTLYTGIRIGELCALKWSDVNFESSEIYINKTLQRIKAPSQGKSKTKIIICEPKTRTSIRVIPIAGFLLDILKRQRDRAGANEGYVLTGSEKYTEPSNYYMKYRRYLKKAGVRHYSFHTLRHTFATRCIENNFDAKTLSEILGHSDVKITLNRYVHPSMELKRQQINQLSSLYVP